jgi:hypothetical protein
MCEQALSMSNRYIAHAQCDGESDRSVMMIVIEIEAF